MNMAINNAIFVSFNERILSACRQAGISTSDVTAIAELLESTFRGSICNQPDCSYVTTGIFATTGQVAGTSGRAVGTSGSAVAPVATTAFASMIAPFVGLIAVAFAALL